MTYEPDDVTIFYNNKSYKDGGAILLKSLSIVNVDFYVYCRKIKKINGVTVGYEIVSCEIYTDGGSLIGDIPIKQWDDDINGYKVRLHLSPRSGTEIVNYSWTYIYMTPDIDSGLSSSRITIKYQV